jgi:hypothetical protein
VIAASDPLPTADRPHTRDGPAPFDRRSLLAFLTTSVGFPVGGLLATTVGPVDAPLAAALAAAIAGTVIGAVQWLVLRRHGVGPRWIVATPIGLAVGLTAGSAAVGYGTGARDLVLQGLVSGAAVGAAQGRVLGPVVGVGRASAWALAAPLLWALGWSVTAAAGVGVEARFAVFGATGALTHTALGGGLLVLLLRAPRPDTSPDAHSAPREGSA